MRRVEIACSGDLSVGDRLAEIRAWLDDQGISSTALRAIRILEGRVIFSATFEKDLEAERFQQAFGNAE